MSSPALVLLEIGVKTTVVFLAAWVVTTALARRASAAARHLVWATALAAALTMPALVLLGPGWPVAEVPDAWSSRMRGIVERGATALRADGEIWPAADTVSSHAPNAPTPTRAAGVPADRGAQATLVRPWRIALPTLVVSTWAAGVLAGLFSLGIGLLWARRMTRRAEALIDPAWQVALADACTRLGVTRRVRLLMSDAVNVPVACGVVDTAIVMPCHADAWSAERRAVVLLHELAHVTRRDCLMQAVAHLTWALNWYNPLALVAAWQLRAEQERASDDLVIQTGTSAVEYAGHLCDIAGSARRMLVPTWATLAVARPSRLEARVTAILDDSRRRGRPSRRLMAALAAGVMVAVPPLGAVRTSMAARAATEFLPSSALNAVAPYSPLIAALSPTAPPSRRQAPDPTVDKPTGSPLQLSSTRPQAQELNATGARAFLDSCTSCHNGQRRTANLTLDDVDAERVAEQADLWERVVRNLRAGLHPPAGVPRPSRAAADAFAGSIEAALNRADQAHRAPGAVESLSDRELAERLARFLWSSQPDDVLTKLVAKGRLHSPTVLDEQVRRMIADARSGAFLKGFFGEWLYLKNLPKVKPDAVIFPEFDEGLRQAFGRETELFLESQVRGNRPIPELLSADYTFLNERLAAHYGVEKIVGDHFRRVNVTSDARRGVLGHASILAITSFANRTSPVVRGKWLLETWLGVTPPPPPANVPAMKTDGAAGLASVRTRLEQHRKNAVCATCHVTMDSFGFALENFDALGRWRTIDAGEAIDALGVLPDGIQFDGPTQLRDVLLDRRDAIARTVTARLLAYALGRSARFSDMPTVRAVVWDAAPRNYAWVSVIAGVVKSPAFQSR